MLDRMRCPRGILSLIVLRPLGETPPVRAHLSKMTIYHGGSVARLTLTSIVSITTECNENLGVMKSPSTDGAPSKLRRA